MLPKDLDDYGGQKVDAKPLTNPRSQYGAEKWMRAHEDVAQMTRTITRGVVSFITVNSGDPLPSGTLHRSLWGIGSPQKPVVTRTSQGLYVVTYASSFDDGLGLDDSVENVAFAFPPWCAVMSSDNADDIYVRPFAFTSNAFSLQVESPKGTLADFGDNGAAALTVMAGII